MNKIRVKVDTKPNFVCFDIPVDSDGKVNLGNNIKVSKEILINAISEWVKNGSEKNA